MKRLIALLGLRSRIATALALASAGTAIILLFGALWIVDGIIDRADQRELRGHYDALQSVLAAANARGGGHEHACRLDAAGAGRPWRMAIAPRCWRFFGAGFAELKSAYGVEQFQFHTAPATSFLRVHQPEKFGDDLSGFRKTVVEANATNKPVLGLGRRRRRTRNPRRGADRVRRQAGGNGRVRLVIRPAVLRRGSSSRATSMSRSTCSTRTPSRPSVER